MTESAFPATRFGDAGATEFEVEQLSGEFDRSDLAVRSSLVDSWAAQSVGDLRDELTMLRAAGHFVERAPEGAETAEDASTGQSGAAGVTEPKGAVKGSQAGSTADEGDSASDSDSTE